MIILGNVSESNRHIHNESLSLDINSSFLSWPFINCAETNLGISTMLSAEFSAVIPHFNSIQSDDIMLVSNLSNLSANDALSQRRDKEVLDARAANRGRCFTSQGPPQYEGKDILEDPQLLWLDDAEWDEERINEAQMRIKIQGPNAPVFWREKYVKEASKYWHIFYKRNTDHFYKDRHYLHVVFPELLQVPAVDSLDGCTHLLEVGCGVGNAILPLVDLNPFLSIQCIDFAASAIEILRSNPIVAISRGKIKADVCDVVADEIPVNMGSQDLVLCMFVLSAIEPKVTSSTMLAVVL